ncbi:MFS transporter [Actinomadura barringtoniae]|uniref:MFS transporter n=1 Tax=Actinomadura barringtoniae TaxID=1427535 RepID=A0A939T5G9_9ACTN|nr:MFS transporter [Actinomadura barringtoniae]MBO2450623.1 MFS transporter [Actinomadura barringtoniae]
MTKPAWTLAVASTAGYLLVLDLVGVNIALPNMQERLNASLAEVQWTVDAYAFTLASLLLAAGALADRYGRRRLFLLGLGVFTAASLGCALAPSAPVLDVVRALQGFGGALLFGTTAALLAAAYPAGRERNRALGIFSAASGGAIATAPLVGGGLTELFDWRAIFFLNVPIGLIGFVIALRMLEESYDPRPRPLDLLGTGLLTGGLAALMWALIDGPHAGWGSPQVLAALAVAALAFTGLALHRVAEPMIDLSLLRNKLYAANALGGFTFNIVGAGSTAYFSLYVQGPMHARPAEAGLWFLAFSIPALAAPLALSRSVHRFPPAALVAIGPLLCAVSAVLSALTYGLHSWPALLPAFIIGGTGIGVGNLVSGQIGLASAPAERAGLASALTQTAKQLGIAVGIAVLGIPYGESGLGAMLATAATIGFLGALPALWLWRSTHRPAASTPAEVARRRPAAR